MKKFVLLTSIIFLIVFTGHGQTVEYNIKMKRFDERQNVLYYKDSPFNGTLIKRYESGVLSSKGSYKDGKADGEWIFYRERIYSHYSDVKSRGLFKDGKKNGEWTFYSETGKLTSKGFFKDGKEDGEWKTYSEPYGKLKTKEIFKDGERIEYESYNFYGELESKRFL